MDENASLTQYRVFADHRLQFSRLFFQVVAFILLVLLGIALFAQGLPESWWPWVQIGAGLALIEAGFVVHRIRVQEDNYADLLRRIEQRDKAIMLEAPLSARYGARSLVAASLCLTGIVLILVGAVVR